MFKLSLLLKLRRSRTVRELRHHSVRHGSGKRLRIRHERMRYASAVNTSWWKKARTAGETKIGRCSGRIKRSRWPRYCRRINRLRRRYESRRRLREMRLNVTARLIHLRRRYVRRIVCCSCCRRSRQFVQRSLIGYRFELLPCENIGNRTGSFPIDSFVLKNKTRLDDEMSKTKK